MLNINISRTLLLFCKAIVTAVLLTTSALAQTILVVGDSLSAAYQMDQDQGWVHLLQERIEEYSSLDHHVVNASISGDTSAGGLSRLPNALASHQPQIVLIELGANDGLRGLSLKQLKSNLTDMIHLAQAQGATVLLTEMSLPPNYGEIFRNRFRQAYHFVHKNTDTVLIPFPLNNIGGVDTLTQKDGLHPNAKAQPFILNNIWPYLQPLLKR